MTSLFAQSLFAHPEWLWSAASALAIAGLVLLAAYARARRRLRALLGTAIGLTASGVRDALAFTAVAAIAVALLGPRIGQEERAVSTSGVDLVILVDVSKSMDAADVPPSRLDRAKRAAVAVLERLQPGDRAALAAFAGRGVLLTPLTPDIGALLELVPALDTQLVRPRGSDLRAGVERAIAAFDPASERPRLLLVLSDGEAATRGNSGEVLLQRANVRALGGALGSELGATIPDHGVPLRDRAGQVVLTRRMLRPLARLADATDGTLFVADEWGRFDLDALDSAIHALTANAPGEVAVRSVTVPVVLPFAALAFLLLGWEMVWDSNRLRLPRRRGGPTDQRPGASRLRGARVPLHVAVVLSAFFSLGPAPSTRGQPDARELLRMGIAHAESQRWVDAEQSFRAAALLARESGVAALAYHNLGVAALGRAELELARDYFFDALAMLPGDRKTQFNLEWTLRALSAGAPRQDPPPAPPPPEKRDPPEASDETETPMQLRLPAPEVPGEDGHEEAEQATAPAPLRPEERERWLRRVDDDPRRALASAARHEGNAGRPARRSEIAW